MEGVRDIGSGQAAGSADAWGRGTWGLREGRRWRSHWNKRVPHVPTGPKTNPPAPPHPHLCGTHLSQGSGNGMGRGRDIEQSTLKESYYIIKNTTTADFCVVDTG